MKNGDVDGNGDSAFEKNVPSTNVIADIAFGADAFAFQKIATTRLCAATVIKMQIRVRASCSSSLLFLTFRWRVVTRGGICRGGSQRHLLGRRLRWSISVRADWPALDICWISETGTTRRYWRT